MDNRTLKSAWPVFGVLAALALVLPLNVAHAQQDQRCFAETSYCISGRIREYWEQNGGLPVFGLPITAQHEETIEGKPYQVQWFERNRLELHPENRKPYDVLLGRLGVDRLTQQGKDWAALPKADQSTIGGDCQFFAQTSHSVCDAFLKAFKSYGLSLGARGVSAQESLALFGLPVSEQMTETLSDGNQYVVQYFERARFELHPENKAPYNVLFGLLGAEYRGLTSAVPAGQDVVKGTITYRNRSALPPNALVTVSLVDVSRADAQAVVLTKQEFTVGERQVPYAFELAYDPTLIKNENSYAVQARITVDGKLRYLTTQRYAVITGGNPTEIEIVVDPV